MWYLEGVYFYISLAFCFTSIHVLTKELAADIVARYLDQTEALLSVDQYTDGCSSPFKTYIHRYLTYSHTLCAAHDFGSLGYIDGARPGWHNNLITWLAHMSQRNPVYWVWGTIVALFTLPWVVWRRNFGIKAVDYVGFYVILIALSALYFLIKYKAEITAWTS